MSNTPSSWHKLKPNGTKGSNSHCHKNPLKVATAAGRAVDAWRATLSASSCLISGPHENLSLDPHDLPQHVSKAELESLPGAPQIASEMQTYTGLVDVFLEQPLRSDPAPDAS